jgi:hypothetical protein
MLTDDNLLTWWHCNICTCKHLTHMHARAHTRMQTALRRAPAAGRLHYDKFAVSRHFFAGNFPRGRHGGTARAGPRQICAHNTWPGVYLCVCVCVCLQDVHVYTIHTTWHDFYIISHTHTHTRVCNWSETVYNTYAYTHMHTHTRRMAACSFAAQHPKARPLRHTHQFRAKSVKFAGKNMK